MEAHVLNGDALAEKFAVDGPVVVCRECMIEGPVQASTLDQFWKQRASYLCPRVGEPDTKRYELGVREEFEKLTMLTPGASLNLWFEHDLFCQANMWFVIHFLQARQIRLPVYRVMPPPRMPDVWSGFGNMVDGDLIACFKNRVLFSEEELQLGVALWNAYSNHDLHELRKLSNQEKPCYPFLEEVCTAHAARFEPNKNGRPQKRLREIINEGHAEFHTIFTEFNKTEGIYGFGDLQVKNMLADL